LFVFGIDSDLSDILSFLKKSLLIEGPLVIRFMIEVDSNIDLLGAFFIFSLFERLWDGW